jgi:hypothetical protein
MKNISVIFLMFACLACGPIQRVDTVEVKEVIGNLEIKRLTPAQITAQVETLGEKVVITITPAFENAMKSALKSQSLEVCQLKNIKLIDSLSSVYKIKVRLLGTADVLNKTLYDKEREVIDAYVYNAENKLPLTNNIQKIGDSLFVYSAPIAAETKICEQCFSSDDNKLAVWSIIFRKAEVIRKVDMKKMK